MKYPSTIFLRIHFKWDHRINSLTIRNEWRWLPSAYRSPFLSVRWLCFWYVQDWAPIGYNPNGGVKIK